MELIDPSMAFAASFLEAIAEFNGEHIHGMQTGVPFTDVSSYVERVTTQAKGKDLPEGWTPSHTYWLVEDGEFIAIANIRHYLTPDLEKRGGHIGYSVRPSRQNQGHGTELLRLALGKAKDLGIDRVLITCSKDNIGSRKVIEKNGGVLQDEVELDGEKVLRFWIEQ